ncbi:MAG: hypothetical protein LBP54_08160 [Campylobacteraceae bacterium]|nr:hypothetical protein [Campylobacteraceae bacterium]
MKSILYIGNNKNTLQKNGAGMPHCQMSANSHLLLKDNSSVEIEQNRRRVFH